MQKFVINKNRFYQVIVLPAFQDLIPTDFNYNGTLNEFTVYDEVSSYQTIIDIRRVQNILQRRDASCEINYKRLFGTSTRKVYTDELYAAVKLCRNELYVGCLKDWRNDKQAFEDKILPFFQGAVMTDIASNSYFGDVARVTATTSTYSTNIFDGIFKWIGMYLAAGVIPAAQSLTIADGTDYTVTPNAAYTLLKSMYDKQNVILRSELAIRKAFYVSQEIADGYTDYLAAANLNAIGTVQIENGKNVLAYKGIPIFIEPMFTPVITELKGSAGYAAVLTYRGNFIFATDKNYGEGANGDQSLIVRYDEDEFIWKWQVFMKAGTQIALPEHIIFAISTF